jgi:hypothetical protein
MFDILFAIRTGGQSSTEDRQRLKLGRIVTLCTSHLVNSTLEVHSTSPKPREGLLEAVGIICVVVQEPMVIREIFHDPMERRWLGGIRLQVIEKIADRRVEPRSLRAR